jgi:hypothetical protein
MNARRSHLAIYRRRASLLHVICIISLLLGAFSTALAEIPLPRPRPADIPSDRFHESAKPQLSQCQQQLAELARFRALPPITGPGECGAVDVVALDSVALLDKNHAVLSPPAVLRCPMAEAVANWLRDDVAPIIATLGTALRGVETLDSFACRGRNGASGGKLSEHGRANALDVRALKLADGRVIEPTDDKVSKSLREALHRSACARFTTVLGNGADAYHENHVHLDLLERSNNYRICQWDVLDVAESEALAVKKTMAAADTAQAIERDVPLPRPRPILAGETSKLSQHRHQHFREATRWGFFDFISPLMKYGR